MSQNNGLFWQCPPNKQGTKIDEIKKQLNALLSRFHYDGCQFSLLALTQHKQTFWLLDLKIEGDSNSGLAELISRELCLLLPSLSSNYLLYYLMEALIKMSDEYVNECFSYDGFKRFSIHIPKRLQNTSFRIPERPQF